MAINLMTIEGVADVAKEGKETINLLTASQQTDTKVLVSQAIAHIKNKIDQLKGSEQDFLNHFSCGSIGEFKSRVSKYYAFTGLINFTGSSLRKYTDEYKAAMNKSNEQLAEDINNILINLQEYAIGQTEKDLEAILRGEAVSKAAADRVMSLLIKEMSNFGVGTLSSTKFLTLTSTTEIKDKNSVDDTYFFNLCANLTTEAFRKNMDNLKKIARGEINKIVGKQGKSGKAAIVEVDKDLAEKAQKLITANEKSKKITGTSLEQVLVIDWSDLIKEATSDNTGKASKLIYAKDSAELESINMQITERIISEYGIDGTFKDYARQKITSMWKQDPTMFFIGGSANKLTGLLGEINTMIALTDLLSEKFKGDILNWVASNEGQSSKKQPSVDIALGEIGKYSYGIQVKNTTMDLKTDISHFISFADKSIDGILESLNIPSGGEAIKNVYTSDVFNVPYKREGENNYVEVSPSTPFSHNDPSATNFHKYTKLDEEIDSIVNQINLYLSRFASDFLYIGFENDNKGFKSALAALEAEVPISGNFVYIVGPEVHFASEMLEQLQKELEALQEIELLNEQTSLRFEAYFGKLEEDNKTKFNIVSKLNSGGSLRAHTIKMRSSFGFSG